jgi:hypothetical protein
VFTAKNVAECLKKILFKHFFYDRDFECTSERFTAYILDNLHTL